MYNSILANATANFVLNKLNYSQNSISKSLERMSSGLKINSAKDDTAGSVISAKTNVELSGLNVASKNAMHGINMLNVADSSLENMINKISRIRDLSFQATNSTYSKEELNAIQSEIDELIEEIKREKDTTIYNEKKIFDPSINKTEEIKPPQKPYAYEVEYLSYPTNSTAAKHCIELGSFADYDAIDFTFSSTDKSNKDVLLGKAYNSGFIAYDTASEITMGYNPTPSVPGFSISENITPEQKGDGTKRTLHFEFDFSKYPNSIMAIGGYTTNTFTKAKQIYQITCYKDGQMVRDFIPVIDNNNEACLYDKVTGQFFYNQGSVDFGTGDTIPPEESEFITTAVDNSVDLQIGRNAGKENTVNIDLGFNLDIFDINVSSINACKVSIQRCNELIDVLSYRRAQVGSAMNRIDSIIELQNNDIVNLNIKNSLIKDSDIAIESTNLAQAQILQEVSSSLFAQANSMNGSLALRLLGM